MINLLCPTRGRPDQLKRMMKSAASTSVGEIFIYCGLTDEECGHYEQPGYYKDYLQTINEIYEASQKRVRIATCFFPDGMPTAHKWNTLAALAINTANKEKSGLFMLAADDMVFTTPCWDAALMDHYNALENKVHVYALRDSRDGGGTPHPIVSRECIDALGYFLPPIFLHWFVDSWLVDIARQNGVFTHMPDYLLVHDKPSDDGKPDETHIRIRNMGWHERDQWVNEHCQHFLQFEKERLRKYIESRQTIAERYKLKAAQ